MVRSDRTHDGINHPVELPAHLFKVTVRIINPRVLLQMAQTRFQTLYARLQCNDALRVRCVSTIATNTDTVV